MSPSGEVLRVHSLAERELPRERPLEPIGDNDLLAVAIVRGALGLDRQDDVVDGHLAAVRAGARPRARVPGPGKPTSGSYSFRRTIQVVTMGGSLR